MNNALIISLMVFVTTVLATGWVYSVVRSRQTAKDWGERIRGKARTVDATHTEKGMAYLGGVFLKVLEGLGQASRPKDNAKQSRLRKTMITAGYRKARAPVIFLGSKVFLAMLLALLVVLFGEEISKKLPGNGYLILIAACAVGGFYVPQLWLRWARDKRKGKLVNGFPDALDLMVVCVEAGLGLDQAIARVGEEIKIGHPDLGEEFKIVSLELRAGFTREQALRNLAERADLEEIRSLIALLIQTDRFGTSVGQALRVHSESMRVTRRLKAEELAAKLPVKLLLPLIFFIFPSLLITIIGPGAIRLMRNLIPAMTK